MTYPTNMTTATAFGARTAAAAVRERGPDAPHPAHGADPRRTPSTLTRAVRFPLGRLLVTPGALEALAVAEAHRGHGARRGGAEADVTGSVLAQLIARHASGDWGTVDAEDWAANDRAVREGTRLLSAYVLDTGERVWIITEADRSATSIILPSEY